MYRPSREKAPTRAEKSRVTTRRKRGLRSHRERGNAAPVIRQPAPKPLKTRTVNHSGRKFIWCRVASNSLASECKKLNKFPRGPLPVGSDRQRLRLKLKCHLRQRWSNYHAKAEAMGVPPVAAFHSSFWKFFKVEVSDSAEESGWGMLLAGLPRAGGRDEELSQAQGLPFRPAENGLRLPLTTLPVNRACRMCGYFGKGPHAWNSCRSDRGRGGVTSLRRGSRRRGDSRRRP
jgi:hypothetical protein